MVQVQIDVVAKVQQAEVKKAVGDMQRTFGRGGSDAGKDFNNNLSRSIGTIDTRGAALQLSRSMSDAGQTAATNIKSNISRGLQDAFRGGNVSGLGRQLANEFRAGFGNGVQDALKSASGSMGAFGKTSEGTLSGIISKAGGAKGGIAAIAVAATTAAAKLYEVGAVWDDVADSITGQTGKIGDDLDAVMGSVKRLSGEVASPIGDIANVAGQVSQATKLSGTDLESLTANVVNFQRVTGQAVDVRQLGKVFRLFDVKDAEAQVQALNDLSNASLTTGAPVSQLIANLSGAGKASKEFGLSIGDTAALLNQFEAAGVDAEKVQTGLTVALKGFAAAGREPADALRETITQIKAFIDAGNDVGATALASQTFGKGYVDFLAVIKNGSLDVDTLDAALKNNNTTIDDLVNSTSDFAEEWQQFKNTLTNAVQPAATELFALINNKLTETLDLFKGVGDGLTGIGFAWQQLTDFVAGRPLAFQVQMPSGPAKLDANGNLVPTAQPPALTNPLVQFGPGAVPPPPGVASTNPLDIFQGINTGQFPQPQAPAAPVLPNIRPNPYGTVGNGFYKQWYDPDQYKKTGGNGPDVTSPYSGDPMSLIAGLPLTSSLYSAAQSVLSAKQDQATAEAKLTALQQDTATTAEQLAVAQGEVQQKRQAEFEAELKLNEAKAQATDKFTAGMDAAAGKLGELGAKIDDDFGVSKGLPGVVDNLIRTISNLGAAPYLGALKGIQDATGQTQQGGSGLIGIRAAQGAYGSDYTYAAWAQSQQQGTNPAAMMQQGIMPGAALPGESARDYAHRVMAPVWASRGIMATDHAADKFGEHQNGALDLPVNSIAQGQSVLQQALSDPGVYGAIFNNATYGYGHGPTPQDYSGGHTGDPSKDHQNHVHVWYKPGEPNDLNPSGAMQFPMSGLPSLAGPSSGPVPVTVMNWPSLGAPSSPSLPAAPTMPSIPTAPSIPSIPTAPTTPLVPTAPTTPVTIGTGPAPGPLPALPPIGGGGGMPSAGIGLPSGLPGAAPTGRSPAQDSTVQPATIGINQNGALGAATAAAGLVPGLGQAAQTATSLINRSIGYAGQLGAIGVSGILETFGLNDSALGDPSKSFLGRLATGLAGARPALPNSAGQQGSQKDPNSTVHGDTNGAAPGPTLNIESFVQAPNRDGQKVLNDLAGMMYQVKQTR